MESGTRLADRYLIEDRLGAGGMGEVWRAQDTTLGRPVAVKVLPADRVGDGEARVRLLREARAAAQLEIRGVVGVYDVATTGDGSVFVVMELVEGESLREKLETDAEVDVVDVLRQAAAVLDAAHARGLVHRDVKPDNLMLDDAGHLVVLDFGLAKRVDLPLADTATPDGHDHLALTRSGMLVGTPAYLSPEQARGEHGPDVDRWSLAVTAYELLTGSTPWKSTSFAPLLAEVVSGEVEPRTERGEAVDGIFRRAFSPERDARFDTASAFAEALADALEAEPAAAGPVEGDLAAAETPPSVAPGETVRRPTAVQAAGLLVGVLGLGAALAVTTWRPAPDPSETAPDTPSVTIPVGAVVACPIHEVTDAPFEQTGWLGAASADAVCRAVSFRQGSDPATVLMPAALLDVPGRPEPVLASLFDEPDARAETLRAAAEADVVLDGRLATPTPGDFRLELRVGERTFEAEAESLVEAGERIADAMVEAGVLATAPLRQSLRIQFGVETLEEAVAFNRSYYRLGATWDGAEACRALSARPFRNRPLFFIAVTMCAGVEGIAPTLVDWETLPELEGLFARPLPSDRPSLEGMAESLARARREHGGGDADLEVGLLVLEAESRSVLGETTDAEALARRATQLVPWSGWAWLTASRLAKGSSSFPAQAQLHALWMPASPDVWRSLDFFSPRGESLENIRRTYHLSPRTTSYGALLGQALLEAGRPEELRDLAASVPLDGPPNQRVLATLLRAFVELQEGRLTDADARLRRFVEEDPLPLGFAFGNNPIVVTWLEVANLLGPDAEMEAARLIEDTYFHDRPRAWDSLRTGGAVCSRVGRERSAACFEAVRSDAPDLRLPDIDDYLEGCELWAEGDGEGARRVWRRVALGPFPMPVDAFDPGTDPERAEAALRLLERYAPPIAGVHPVEVVRARWAVERGDREEARRLARRVTEAWSRLDVRVPALDEMRAILAE